MTLGWVVFCVFIFSAGELSLEFSRRSIRKIFPFIGLSISFLSCMMGLLTLFENEVVKGEFRKNIDEKI